SRTVRQHWTTGMDIYIHTCDGVDEGDGIGTGRGGSYGSWTDITTIGREFYDERERSRSANGSSDVGDGFGTGTKDCSTLLDVWAGNIDFNASYSRDTFEA